MSKKEYISYIGRNYAYDKAYVQKLNKIIKNYTEILYKD
jgi:flagellum-specific peptidoglycan hydrolase FlgJ